MYPSKTSRKKPGLNKTVINDLNNPAINSTVANAYYDPSQYETDDQLPLYPRYLGDVLARGQTAREHKSAREWSFYKQSAPTQTSDGSFRPLGAPLLDFVYPCIRPSAVPINPRTRSLEGDSLLSSRGEDASDGPLLLPRTPTPPPSRPKESPHAHVLALLSVCPPGVTDDGTALLDRKVWESEQRVRQVKSGRGLMEAVREQERMREEERARTQQRAAARNRGGRHLPGSPRSSKNDDADAAAPLPRVRVKPACNALSRPLSLAQSPPLALASADSRVSTIVANVAGAHLIPPATLALPAAVVPPAPISEADSLNSSLSSSVPPASSSHQLCPRYAQQQTADTAARLRMLRALVRDKLVQLAALDTYADEVELPRMSAAAKGGRLGKTRGGTPRGEPGLYGYPGPDYTDARIGSSHGQRPPSSIYGSAFSHSASPFPPPASPASAQAAAAVSVQRPILLLDTSLTVAAGATSTATHPHTPAHLLEGAHGMHMHMHMHVHQHAQPVRSRSSNGLRGQRSRGMRMHMRDPNDKTEEEEAEQKRREQAARRSQQLWEAGRASVVVARSLANSAYARAQMRTRVAEVLSAQDLAREASLRSMAAQLDALASASRAPPGRPDKSSSSASASDNASVHRHALLSLKQRHYAWLAQTLLVVPPSATAADVDALVFTQQALEEDHGQEPPLALVERVVSRLAQSKPPDQQDPVPMSARAAATIASLCEHLGLSGDVFPAVMARHGLVAMHAGVGKEDESRQRKSATDSPGSHELDSDLRESGVYRERAHGVMLQFVVKGDHVGSDIGAM